MNQQPTAGGPDQAILDFLTGHHPFNQLPQEVLAALPPQLETCHLPAGETVLTRGRANVHLHVIRNGGAEVLGPEGEPLAQLAEGDVFGQRSLLGDGVSDNSIRTTEDSVLYRLPAAVFHELCRNHPKFAYFFGPAGRLRSASQGQGITLDPMTIPVADIARGRSPISVPSTVSIRDAAQVMTDKKISSLMVVDDGALKGILTDRDLRTRVVAQGRSFDLPVTEVITTSPVTIPAETYAYEALLTMARRNVHHLPVMEDDQLLGMITDTDLLQRYTTSPLYLVSDVYKRNTVEELAEISRRLKQMLVVLVEANAPAHSIGHLISSVGEAINCRLLALAEERFGPPPIPYAWLAGGSLGRREQTAHTDQDNCLLLPDHYQEEEHGEYFQQMADWVCKGLDACGYILCPGDIMASNPRWRQPLKVWKDYFDRWIDQPDPKALLNSTIFFDLRCLYGEASLFRELWTHVMAKAKDNRIFQAYMAANALSHQPPLGFFRHFVLVKGGEHDKTLDLKLRGVVPVIDVARVYALSGGVMAANTRERLEAAAENKFLSQDSAADLRDALEYISAVRLRHQAQQIRAGKSPDNFMSPRDLSHFERNHLKDAFSVASSIQSSLSQRYQLARFG